MRLVRFWGVKLPTFPISNTIFRIITFSRNSLRESLSLSHRKIKNQKNQCLPQRISVKTPPVSIFFCFAAYTVDIISDFFVKVYLALLYFYDKIQEIILGGAQL